MIKSNISKINQTSLKLSITNFKKILKTILFLIYYELTESGLLFFYFNSIFYLESLTIKSVPTPSWLEISMVPSHISIILFTSAKPNPFPSE